MHMTKNTTSWSTKEEVRHNTFGHASSAGPPHGNFHSTSSVKAATKAIFHPSSKYIVHFKFTSDRNTKLVEYDNHIKSVQCEESMEDACCHHSNDFTC